MVNASAISNFLGAIDLYEKDNAHTQKIVENLGLLVIKNHLSIQFVEGTWLRHLVMKLCPHVVFLFRKTFNQEVLLDLVEEKKKTYVLPSMVESAFPIASFDLNGKIPLEKHKKEALGTKHP
jgi:hypothetical protein